MKMGSIGKSFPQYTSSSGNQMLNRCSRREEVDDFVLIDVDDDIPNVVILDVDESVQKKLRKPSPRTVINIDDDDDEDEAGACSNDNESTSASSSRSSANPVQSKQNGSRQRYVIGSESKSDSTESDCSDCECMEGPSEEIRYQWEQASKRRKTNLNTGVSNNNQASTSASIGKENATTQPCSSSKGKSPFDDFSWAYTSNILDAMRTECFARGDKITKSALKSHYVDFEPLSSVFREDENGDQDNVLFTDELNANLNSDEPCLNEDQAIPERKLSDDSDCEVSDRVAPMDVDEELPNTEFCSSHDYRTISNNSEPISAAGLSGNFKSTNREDLQNHQESEIEFRACPSVHVEAEDVSEDWGKKQCPDDLLIDRQKIKETDVYKRAMEEEIESRKRQLQIQAEEAQRLRRRKKAEIMRNADMEKRKKQRLEEMRETQKKDEENLRLKEQLRAECRNKLNLIENSCKDMASLLRRLGVDVGGNMFPSLAEVQTAYKKAVLKFHPDRSSRTDIRQQVEAEETFKLISKMKEKYLPAQ